jgi:hypothetical protein
MASPPPRAPRTALLFGALRDPASVAHLDAAALDELIHTARQHDLLARLGHDLGPLTDLPAAAQRQIASARVRAAANETTLRFELDRVRRALAGLDTKLVLLKGAAYREAGLAMAAGRVSVDVDVLVPFADIGRVERRMVERGWRAEEMNVYDQHYYRDWMHQIPPLTHPERMVELDIHHTLFPPISGIRIGSEALIEAAVPVGNGLWVLSPADMVLHAAVHLFQEDPSARPRDLLDLHDLLSLFGTREGFWDQLVARARQHGLGRPLWYGLRYATAFLGTAVPAGVTERMAPFAPNPLAREIMDRLVGGAIVAGAPGHAVPGGDAAALALFVRSHWIKMPPVTLLRHTVVKLIWRFKERRKERE